MTARLRDALKTIDVDLHDHIVVDAGRRLQLQGKRPALKHPRHPPGAPSDPSLPPLRRGVLKGSGMLLWWGAGARR